MVAVKYLFFLIITIYNDLLLHDIKGEGFDVMKSGDARVALVGFPSVGKVNT